MATLKEVRKLAGMTQKELADKMRTNPRLIQKYESGEYALENMTAQTISSLEDSLGISLNEMEALDASIFTKEVTSAIKNGDMTLSDAVAASKFSEIKKLSEIGGFEATFYANYKRIPSDLLHKLTPKETADLVDAFYKCYSDGKESAEFY